MKNPGNQQKKDVAPTPESRLPGINDVQLPDLWQICQLAALVSDRLPEGKGFKARTEAKNRVSLAVEIWREAGISLEKLHAKILESHQFGEHFPLLAGPLKVGKHFMPRLPQWTLGDGAIGLELFLPQAVGLAKIEDRMQWWRRFLRFFLKPKEPSSLAWLALSESKFFDDCRAPDDYPDADEIMENALREQREIGILLVPDGVRMALVFRRWRLSMEAPTKSASRPYDIKECAKKGLEAERSKQ